MKPSLPHVLSLLLLAAACSPSTDGPTSDTGDAPVDADPRLRAPALRVHLDALQAAADAHDGHRAVGSAGYDAAVTYVEDTLSDLGLTPRRERVVVRRWTVTDGAVTWAGGEAGSDDLGAMEWSPGGEVTADVVPVDVLLPAPARPNTSTSGCEAADFDGFPAGAIALLQRGTCTFGDKVAQAEAAGAVAVLVFNEGQQGRTGAVTGTLDETSPPGIPVLGASHGLGVTLVDVGRATLRLEAETVSDESHNVLVDMDGTSGQRWVVGAHLDSVPAGPGINDNGTGVATLLQLAAVVQDAPHTHDIRLAFWAAEEVGLVGSLAHVDGLSEAELDRTLGYLNYDMVGSPNPARFVYDSDGSAFGLPEGLPAPAANAVIETAYETHFAERGLDLEPVPYDGRSDYLGFALVGVPTGGLFTGADMFKPSGWADRFGGTDGDPFDACYHRACDDDGNVDDDTFEEMAIAAADVLLTLADQPAPQARRRPRARRAVPLPVRAPGACGHDHALPSR